MAEHWLVCTTPVEPECTWIAQQSSKSVDRSLSAIILNFNRLYTPGMTRQQFFDEAMPDGSGEIGMPEDYIRHWMRFMTSLRPYLPEDIEKRVNPIAGYLNGHNGVRVGLF